MIITISGLPGAGKSVVAKAVAKKLGLKHYSVGDLRGKMAIERGMTLDEFNKLGETEAFTDKDADEYQKKLGETEDDFVIDGRLSFHFIPKSIKIFLKVEPETGAKRIFNDQRQDEQKYKTVQDLIKANNERTESDKKRYRKYYDLDPFKDEHYDLVLDTTELAQEQVVEKVVEFVERH